jgi:hypothetical protein
MAIVLSTEIKRFALVQQAVGRASGIIDLYDAAGKPVANVVFVHEGPLPAAVEDGAGVVTLHLWENAWQPVVAMLTSGAQVYFNWDHVHGSVSTAIQATG